MSKIKSAITDMLNDYESWLKSYKDKNAEGVALWDFDGTLLRGDCAEGYSSGKHSYAGMTEFLIEQGFSKQYPPGSVDKFFSDYRAKEKEEPLEAYLDIARIFAGSSIKEMQSALEGFAEKTIWPHLFEDMQAAWRRLANAGIKNYIISASPVFFVEVAAMPFATPDQIMGIILRVNDGLLTDEVIPPVPFGDGKWHRAGFIFERLRNAGADEVGVWAAFGNHWATDGSFIRGTIDQSHTDVKPLVMLVNPDHVPDEYAAKIQKVKLD